MNDGFAKIEVGSGSSAAGDGFAAGRAATAAALSSIEHQPLSALIVYASSHYEASEVTRGVHSLIGGVPVFGATTAGEISNARTTHSVTVAAIASPHLVIHCAVGRRVSLDWRRALAEALESPAIRSYFDASPVARQHLTREGKSVFAMMLSPGNTRHHDSRGYELLELLKARSMGYLPVVGGSAADDWRLESNAVILGEEVYPDSVLIAIVETELQVGIALTHGFRPTGLETTVTEAKGQEILALDGQPAAKVMANLLGVSRKALAGKHVTLTTGRTIGIADAMGQFGMTVCTFTTANGGLRTAQPLAPGTALRIMEPDSANVMAAGADAVRKAMLRGGITQPAIALVNYCALRARLLGDAGAAREVEAMTEPMAGAPLLGFCSFGEAGLTDDGSSRHANASISLVVIGKEFSHAAQVAREAAALRRDLIRKAGELEQRVIDRTSELSRINAELQLEVQRHQKTEKLLRRNEAAYLELVKDLAVQKQRAEEANRSKSAFLANMSHELRTPLNAIIGFSDLIRSQMLGPIGSPTLGGYIEDIHASGLHLLDLINDLLDLAKIEAGKQDLKLEPLVPAEVVGEAARLMSVRAQECQIDFRVMVSANLGVFQADRRAAKQILLNLLSNAFKFTPKGGRVTIEAKRVSNRLRLGVLDTGIGMSKTAVERIGAPFERVDNAYASSVQGTGLGLALTRALVELHGGKLTIRSKEKKGTTVFVSLPMMSTPGLSRSGKNAA